MSEASERTRANFYAKQSKENEALMRILADIAGVQMCGWYHTNPEPNHPEDNRFYLVQDTNSDDWHAVIIGFDSDMAKLIDRLLAIGMKGMSAAELRKLKVKA